jgi:uncharacterized protein YjbJ (UPF0337 family)
VYSSEQKAGSNEPIIILEVRDMSTLNHDEAEGKWEQTKGWVKDKAGEITNDRDLEAEGEAQRAEGKTQEAWGGVKRGVGDAIKSVGDAIDS